MKKASLLMIFEAEPSDLRRRLRTSTADYRELRVFVVA